MLMQDVVHDKTVSFLEATLNACHTTVHPCTTFLGTRLFEEQSLFQSVKPKTTHPLGETQDHLLISSMTFEHSTAVLYLYKANRLYRVPNQCL